MSAAATAVVLAGAAGLVALSTEPPERRLHALASAWRSTGPEQAAAVLEPAGAGAQRRLQSPPAGRWDRGPAVSRGAQWQPAAARLLRARAPQVGFVAVLLLWLGGQALAAAMVAAGTVVVVLPARRRAAQEATLAEQLARDLPHVADLLASCVQAGLAPVVALDAVCAAVGGPTADTLRPVVTALRLGVDPNTAWIGAEEGTGPLAAEGTGPRFHPLVRPLCRALALASETGAPLAATLLTLADQERERARWEAEAAARKAGVRAVGPLGACFLPAFLLVGVVPVVTAIAGQVLTDLT